MLENTPAGENVVKITAIDPDSGSNAIVNYAFSSSSLIPFSINSSNGQIATAALIDYEFSNFYRLEVRAKNFGISRFASIAVEVYIESENEYYPKFASTEYHYEMSWKTVEGNCFYISADSCQFCDIR